MSYRKLLFLFACIVSLSATAKSTVHNYLVVEPKNPKVLLKELNAPQYTELRPDKEYRFGVGLYGYKDASGKSVIEPQFFAASDFGDGLAAVKRQEKDKWGYIDNTGKMVIEPQFYVAEKFSEGLAPVRLKKNGKWGYIDKSGKEVVPAIFEQVTPFRNGIAHVITKNSRGIFAEFITLNPGFSNFLEIECGSLDSYLAASGLAKPDEASMD